MTKLTSIVVWVATGLLLLSLNGCGGGGGSSSSSTSTDANPTVPALGGKTIAQSITSIQTGQGYSLSIYLPVSYDSGARSYPVIYLTDAETRFTPSLRVLQTQGVEAILVGISNNGTPRRFVDFEMPGSAAYYKFLTLELIPFVEGQFRVDASKRTLNGHSLGGLLVMYAFFIDAASSPKFASFISEEAAIFEQSDTVYAMEQQLFDRGIPVPLTLHLSGDVTSNLKFVLPLCQRIASRHYPGLRQQMLDYGLGHVPMDVPAFGDGLNYVFGLDAPLVGHVTNCL
jgi:hypothetical protein